MCPVCVANAALIAASATSTGGIAALVVKYLRQKLIGPRNQSGSGKNETKNGGEKDGPPGRVAQ